MRGRWSNFFLRSCVVALVVTIFVWIFSYVGVVGHIFRTGSFLLEGKENVDSFFGVTASRGILRIEVFATREPAHEEVDYAKVSRLQTTRIALPLWSFALAFLSIVLLLARRRRIHRYDASLGADRHAHDLKLNQ